MAKLADRLNEMMDARSTYVEAARCLCEASARAFPNGTRVIVTLGRARIDGEVTGVNDHWWFEPGTVRIRNRKTGKARRFEPWDESLALIVVDGPPAVAAVDPSATDTGKPSTRDEATSPAAPTEGS